MLRTSSGSVESAPSLFADVGRVGQVIYFTHHQHLAELAETVRPEARVHEIGSVTAPPSR
jgi:uncharacterized protein YhaN